MGLPELKIEILETSVPGPSGNTSGKWEASLCSCLTSPCSNCKTMFCCCCILKQVANHLGKSGCLWCCCLWPFVSTSLFIAYEPWATIHKVFRLPYCEVPYEGLMESKGTVAATV